MIIIAHRGNLVGSEPDYENSPEMIDRCISGYGFHVEVDLWVTEDGKLFLGHDNPQYEVTLSWLHLRSRFLWIHCKNINALSYMQGNPYSSDFCYFWHQEDDYTLTSNGWVWAYPNKPINVPCKAVCVMPEWDNQDSFLFDAVCTDYPTNYL